MARKCSCKICKKQLTTDIAFKVSNGKTSSYYCNEEEYKEYLYKQEIKDKCYQTISRVTRSPLITPMMKKEINLINQFYEYNIIERTFIDCENSINWFLDNKFEGSEYAKTKYISTIIQNSINNVYNKYIKEQEDMKKLFKTQDSKEVDMEIMNISNDNKTNNTDISSFLD